MRAGVNSSGISIWLGMIIGWCFVAQINSCLHSVVQLSVIIVHFFLFLSIAGTWGWTKGSSLNIMIQVLNICALDNMFAKTLVFQFREANNSNCFKLVTKHFVMAVAAALSMGKRMAWFCFPILLIPSLHVGTFYTL